MRGFTNIFRVETATVNISSLEELRSGSKVTPDSLVESRLVRKKNIRIKILGNGDLTKKLDVTAHAFSKSAVEKIESAGGNVTVIDAPKSDEAPAAEPAE